MSGFLREQTPLDEKNPTVDLVEPVKYAELEDEDGEDTGEFARMQEVDSVPCWICYIVAEK